MKKHSVGHGIISRGYNVHYGPSNALDYAARKVANARHETRDLLPQVLSPLAQSHHSLVTKRCDFSSERARSDKSTACSKTLFASLCGSDTIRGDGGWMQKRNGEIWEIGVSSLLRLARITASTARPPFHALDSLAEACLIKAVSQVVLIRHAGWLVICITL